MTNKLTYRGREWEWEVDEVGRQRLCFNQWRISTVKCLPDKLEVVLDGHCVEESASNSMAGLRMCLEFVSDQMDAKDPIPPDEVLIHDFRQLVPQPPAHEHYPPEPEPCIACEETNKRLDKLGGLPDWVQDIQERLDALEDGAVLPGIVNV